MVKGQGLLSAELGASVISNVILITLFKNSGYFGFEFNSDGKWKKRKGLREDSCQDLLQVRNSKGQLVQRKVYAHLSLFHFLFYPDSRNSDCENRPA